MTKLTPLERYEEWQQKALQLGQAAIEANFADSEDMLRILSDAALSLKQRIKAFKRLQAWPRIVRGLYDAQLLIAQKQKKDNPAQVHGEPSEIAYEEVGKAIGLKSDRVKDLCKKGLADLRQGLPSKTKPIAALKRELSTTVSESDAAIYRQTFAEQKKLALSAFEHRFSNSMRSLV